MERLEYALHYGIPYPRMEHVKQFSVRQYEDRPQDAVEAPRSMGYGAIANAGFQYVQIICSCNIQLLPSRQSKLDQALARKAKVSRSCSCALTVKIRC